MLQSQGSFETGIDDSCLLPVVERFVSVNGEGPRAGRLAAFIRFAGCNLACSWCDTAWANVENCDHEDMEPRDLVEWVSDTGASCVTLTGGEPALQRGLPHWFPHCFTLASGVLAMAVLWKSRLMVQWTFLSCMTSEANFARSAH